MEKGTIVSDDDNTNTDAEMDNNIKSSKKNIKNESTSNKGADEDDAANALASLNKLSSTKDNDNNNPNNATTTTATTTNDKNLEKNNENNNVEQQQQQQKEQQQQQQSDNKLVGELSSDGAEGNSSSASTNNNNKSDKNSKGYKNRKGRKGDPRMHRAVAARMADPTMTLLDALRAGGFNYPLAPPNTGKDGDDGINNSNSMYNVEDEEGVQLGQRKNQLSRRLRQLIRKGGGGSSCGAYSDSDGSTMSKKNHDATEGEDSDDDYKGHHQPGVGGGIGIGMGGAGGPTTGGGFAGMGNINGGLPGFNYNPYSGITTGLTDPMVQHHMQQNAHAAANSALYNHQLHHHSAAFGGMNAGGGVTGPTPTGMPTQQSMQQQLAYKQFQTMRRSSIDGGTASLNSGGTGHSSSQHTPLTTNTTSQSNSNINNHQGSSSAPNNTSNSRGFLLALQQQHQMQFAAAAAATASRSNLAMHNNYNTMIQQSKNNDTNSLSSFVNNLYNGIGSTSVDRSANGNNLGVGASGSGIGIDQNNGNNAHNTATTMLSNKIMNNNMNNNANGGNNGAHGAILDNFMQNSMRSDMSSISSTFGLSKFSRGSKDANSDVSSFLNACKKIHSDISWHGKEDRDLSCCSTFGASTKTTNEMSGSNSTSQELSSPLFKEFSTSTNSNLSNFHNMNVNGNASAGTGTGTANSLFNTSTASTSVNNATGTGKTTGEGASTGTNANDDDMNVEALHENVRKDMEKFNSFHKYLETQQSVVTDLLSIVGKLPDEPKMRKAVDFYRVESTTLMKSSMIKAGFSPEQTEECDKNYLGFVARKLDHEIRRVKRLTNEMKQRMAMNNVNNTFNSQQIVGVVGGGENSTSNLLDGNNNNNNEHGGSNKRQRT